MDKADRSELQRVFLAEGLPDPLTPASRHLQILDRFFADTRLRLRQIRDPYEQNTLFTLQQLIERSAAADVISSEIHLDADEVEIFARVKCSEIRMNRYFHEFDRGLFTIDVFLGPLKGLVMASVEFQDSNECAEYIAPPFCLIEVTNSSFFTGRSLSHRNIVEVEKELEKLRRP